MAETTQLVTVERTCPNERVMFLITSGFAVKKWSDVLDCWVIWLRDVNVQSEIERLGTGLAIYTLAELQVIAREHWSPEQIKIGHQTKIQLHTRVIGRDAAGGRDD